VIGAGDIAHGDLLKVPLTTVGWAKEELGRRAAELIFDQIGGREEVTFRRVIIPPHLVIRESSGARVHVGNQSLASRDSLSGEGNGNRPARTDPKAKRPR
jgi:hypothetical protein